MLVVRVPFERGSRCHRKRCNGHGSATIPAPEPRLSVRRHRLAAYALVPGGLDPYHRPVNENHALCASPEWAEHLHDDVLRMLVSGVDLGSEMLEIGPGPALRPSGCAAACRGWSRSRSIPT